MFHQTLILILNDVIKNVQEQENILMVAFRGIQKFWRRKKLKQVKQFHAENPKKKKNNNKKKKYLNKNHRINKYYKNLK